MSDNKKKANEVSNNKKELNILSNNKNDSTALAQHIAAEHFITFTEMNDFLRSRGVDVVGDEELSGEHLRLPHVHQGTTLFAPVSTEYIGVVESLFQKWPVTLAIADPASFRSGELPWHVVWTGGPDAHRP